MSANNQPGGSGLWMLVDLYFIVLSLMGLFLPLPMVHLLLSGHALIGASGLFVWLRGECAYSRHRVKRIPATGYL
jgi:hypothetical protein